MDLSINDVPFDNLARLARPVVSHRDTAVKPQASSELGNSTETAADAWKLSNIATQGTKMQNMDNTLLPFSNTRGPSDENHTSKWVNINK
jgi:hypothetical protein